jgi:hypothetical protein
MKNYNKVKECPPQLEKWLDIVNGVPFGGENYLRGWDIFVSNAYFELTGEDVRSIIPPPPEADYGDWAPPTHEQQEALEKSVDKATATLKEETAKYPKLYSYLFDLPDGTTSGNVYDEIRYVSRKYQYEKSAYLRFETFQQMRTDIRKIAQSCMSYQETGNFTDNEAVLERLGFKRQSRGHRSNFVIKDGVIDFESELINTTRGISAERLRICPVCDEIFWAKKTNTKTCGKDNCVNGLQNRKKKERKEMSAAVSKKNGK